MPVLHIVNGATLGYVSLDRDMITIGRRPDCDVVAAGHDVASEHAHILRKHGQFFIEDCQSRNGTFVNDQQVAGRTPLQNNDCIRCADFLATFLDPDTPESFRLVPPVQTAEAELDRATKTGLTEKLETLLDFSERLGRTSTAEEALQLAVECLFRLFRQTDRAFVILPDPTGNRLAPCMIKTRYAHEEATAGFSRHLVDACLAAGEPIYVEDATSDSRFGLSNSTTDACIRSAMMAPLRGQNGTVFGVIQLDTQEQGKRFACEDLRILAGVANQLSTALQNEQLRLDLVTRERVLRDLELAREVQRGFRAQSLPEVPGYEFFANQGLARQVGGDFHAFIPLPPNRLGVVLGDVAGKGMPAFILSTQLQVEARYCLRIEPDLTAAVSRLNDQMLQAGCMDRFVTLAIAVLDHASHVVTLINAGHVAPMIYRPGKGLEDGISNADSGLPLGVVEGVQYTAAHVELKPGECVLLFTDGVTDAMNVQNAQFQMKGIHAAIQGGPLSAPQLGERIVKAVKQHEAGRSQHDDITLLCFGRTGS